MRCFNKLDLIHLTDCIINITLFKKCFFSDDVFCRTVFDYYLYVFNTFSLEKDDILFFLLHDPFCKSEKHKKLNQITDVIEYKERKKTKINYEKSGILYEPLEIFFLSLPLGLFRDGKGQSVNNNCYKYNTKTRLKSFCNINLV